MTMEAVNIEQRTLSNKHSISDIEQRAMLTPEQKQEQLALLMRDHAVAVEAFQTAAEAREKRLKEAFQVHATCMDERDTFASEATGEPLGSMELFASPGGKVSSETLVRLYAKQIAEARTQGKELNLWLMPHTCGADGHSGCAAFKTDEKAQIDYFSKLADELRSMPAFADVNIRTAFYDTDTHALSAFHGTELPVSSPAVAKILQTEKGKASVEAKGDWDRAHSGNRIYIGNAPRAWTARRNAAYHLSPGMEREELLDGIALAVKVIKSHSHVDLSATPIVIQLDQDQTGNGLEMSDADLVARLNASANLSDPNQKIALDEIMIVRTQTNQETWEGDIASQSERLPAAA